jgi:hypothetical protein
MDGGDDVPQGFPLSASFCIPLLPTLSYANQPEALITNKGYHIVITTTIHVNRVAKRLEGNIGKYAGERSIMA